MSLVSFLEKKLPYNAKYYLHYRNIVFWCIDCIEMRSVVLILFWFMFSSSISWLNCACVRMLHVEYIDKQRILIKRWRCSTTHSGKYHKYEREKRGLFFFSINTRFSTLLFIKRRIFFVIPNGFRVYWTAVLPAYPPTLSPHAFIYTHNNQSTCVKGICGGVVILYVRGLNHRDKNDIISGTSIPAYEINRYIYILMYVFIWVVLYIYKYRGCVLSLP